MAGRLVHFRDSSLSKDLALEPVVQSTINTNPWLIFDLLFWFMYFCSTICFKTLKSKSSIDQRIFVE